MPIDKRLETLVIETLTDWERFAAADVDKRLGKTFQELLAMVVTFCNERDWSRARHCCEVMTQILELGWDNWPRMQVDSSIAEAVLDFYYATTYVGQDKIDLAVDFYRLSSKKFNIRMTWMPAATGWFCAGKIYRHKEEWRNSIWAFQESLNALENLTSRTQNANVLFGRVEAELKIAKNGLEGALRGRAVVRPPKKIDVTDEEEKIGVRKLHIVREIAAGLPRSSGEEILETNLNDDNIVDTIMLDTAHLKGADLGFQVKGKSMVEDGILDGDYVLVRLVNFADNGDIIVAAIHSPGEDTEKTLKKLYKEDNHVRLQPMNSVEKIIVVVPPGVDVKPIEAKYQQQGKQTTTRIGEVQIIGKVVAIWRRTEK